MKKGLLFISMMVVALNIMAQQEKDSMRKRLEIKDVTPELSVYPCQDRYEALVVIRCSEDFELEFKSNVDKELNITREQEGTEKIYSIVLKTREVGTSFRGRMLSIMAPNFDKLYLPLELKQKEKKEYLVSDPYSSLRSPFYISMDKANALFASGMYDQAIDQYHIAQQCPEYKKYESNVNEHLILCDSMIYWTAVVDTADAQGDFYRAKEYLLKMMSNNPDCQIIKERYQSTVQEYNIRCNADMIVGAQYMTDGYYEKAKEVYENAVRMRNPQTAVAELNLHEIEKLTFNKKNKTRTFFYQHTDNRPIGFTSARCTPSSTKGYFSMGLNKKCFDLLNNTNQQFEDETPRLDYEASVSFGWTVPLFRSYLFAYFTPFGYTGGGFSKLKTPEIDNPQENNGLIETTSGKNFWEQDIRWYHAVTPEAGIVLKVWHIAVNYKYQYRYWIGQDDATSKLLGTTCQSIGIGFAW